MDEELMITKEDLVSWLDRPPSNDDLDLIGFITTRLENFYKLEQENKQLKEELQEANDNIIWWSNRFNAVERDNRQLKNEIQLRIKSIEKLENDIIEYQRKIQELKEKYK